MSESMSFNRKTELQRAADEIKRLRAENIELRREVKFEQSARLQCESDNAEISARTKAAEERLAKEIERCKLHDEMHHKVIFETLNALDPSWQPQPDEWSLDDVPRLARERYAELEEEEGKRRRAEERLAKVMMTVEGWEEIENYGPSWKLAARIIRREAEQPKRIRAAGQEGDP